MLRKIVLSMILVVATVVPAVAQTETMVEDLAIAEAIQSYDEQLDQRSDPSAHRGTVSETMNAYDGRIIIEQFVDGESFMMVWDAGLDNVVIMKNGDALPLDTYTDEMGRPAFEYGDLYGWLDVAGDNLFLEVSTGETPFWFWVELPQDKASDSTLPMSVIVKVPTKCVCKGSSEARDCTEHDCDVHNQCWNGTAHSTCDNVPIGVKQPSKPGCLSVRADGVVFLGTMGIVTFCGPVRRRVIRRICRNP